MPPDRPVTATDILVALGELASAQAVTGQQVSALATQLSDSIAWARYDRKDAAAALAAAQAEIGVLRSSHAEDQVAALRARIAELEQRLDAPPPTLIRVGSKVGALAEVLISGFTWARLGGLIVGVAGIAITVGLAWQVWQFPPETGAAIVMRILDIIAGMTGGGPPATAPDMVPS